MSNNPLLFLAISEFVIASIGGITAIIALIVERPILAIPGIFTFIAGIAAGLLLLWVRKKVINHGKNK